jgi:hypothetical protein
VITNGPAHVKKQVVPLREVPTTATHVRARSSCQAASEMRRSSIFSSRFRRLSSACLSRMSRRNANTKIRACLRTLATPPAEASLVETRSYRRAKAISPVERSPMETGCRGGGGGGLKVLLTERPAVFFRIPSSPPYFPKTARRIGDSRFSATSATICVYCYLSDIEASLLS